ALSASAKLICRFITMAPFRELPATTASAASAMTAETDKSAFPKRPHNRWQLKLFNIRVKALGPINPPVRAPV
ncbi:hypothetical protein, partial [Ralstonia solanacearum species complex bacterium KE711]|uniref:hypothetical protein n=1 Tax=Ralstonia solanacearum species complex bacterium KE711 TaxID=3119583 RepID=UPI002FC28476